jgi:RNA polymerase sigma factor (TIGR02999 family)
MRTPSPGEVTGLLLAWRRGDQSALNRLVPLVYAELRRIAHARMRAQPLEASLQTTGLVNEAYLRLTDAAQVPWQDRIHFMAICAQIMRRVLVDSARARGSGKRGGRAHRVEFIEDFHALPVASEDLLRLDDALNTLELRDPRKAKAIELRFFGGLSVEEAAAALGVSRETLLRDWRMARAWLKSELSRTSRNG